MNAARSFKKHFAHKPLLRIYTDKIKPSGAIGLDRTRPAQLDARLNEELDLIIRKVHQGNYRFTAYKEKLILKGATSQPRQISIPTARDRIVLRALCDCLAEIYPLAKLALPQEVINDLKTGVASGKYAEYAKIDLKNFYPSIPHTLIRTAIWKKARKPELRSLIEAAITTPTWIDLNKVDTRPSYKLPMEIAPRQKAPVAAENSLYVREEKGNGLEEKMSEFLSDCENVRWWHRNSSGRGFVLNGPINHYPDFVLKLHSGLIILLETKGGDRDNSDSSAKIELGKYWERCAGRDYRYLMVFEHSPLEGAYSWADACELLKNL